MGSRRPPTRRVKAGKSGHKYIVDGHTYAGRGVTTLIGAGVPKPALIGWAARVTAEAAVNDVRTWWPMVKEGRERAAVEYLKEARWQSTNEAATRGTDVHALAARLAEGETVEVDETTEALVDAYLAFREDWRPRNERVERMVVSRKHVYAGTLDLLAELEGWPWVPELGKSLRDTEPGEADGLEVRPARVLADLKTGARGVYPEVVLQLAAYRFAETMLPGLEGGPLDEEPMPEVDACAVVWLRDDATYELLPIDVDERAFRTFLYAAQVAGFAGRDGWGDEAVREAVAPAPASVYQKSNPTEAEQAEEIPA